MRAQQTIRVAKARAPNLAVALGLAKPYAQQPLGLPRETPRFYHFRLRDPSEFLKGTWRTDTPQVGVQVVSGELR